MPPPVPHTLKRMTAQPSRPVQRYRPGKPTQQDGSSEEEEESEEEQTQHKTQRSVAARPAAPQSRHQQIPHDDEDSDEEGFVTEDEDADGTAEAGTVQPPTATGSTTRIQSTTKATLPTISSDESGGGSQESSEGSGEDESSEEESSSSEDERQTRKFIRPTFMKKADRNTSTEAGTRSTPAARDNIIQNTSSLTFTEQARRLDQAEELIKDKLERDALARSQGRKAWDDDDELLPEDMVDDTDGLDPEGEHAAWKLRELKRLKRDRDQIEVREKEIEEIERRRHLTAEERAEEDRVYIDNQRREKDETRSQAAYLSRYHHKGAFFQDDESAEILKKRDVMGAKFVDEVDKSTLPEYMRIRDMTKLGKKGRTRYTDLKGQDTGRFGDEVRRWRGANVAGRDVTAAPPAALGNGYGEVDERFRPDDPFSQHRRDGRTGPTGANASVIGQKRERYAERGPRDGDRNNGDRFEGGARDGSSRHGPDPPSRSRSRSPRRRRDDNDGDAVYRSRRRSDSRSRPASPDRDRDRDRDRDKRRRIES